MTPQFGASLSDEARVVIYDRNTFMIQVTGNRLKQKRLTMSKHTSLLNFPNYDRKKFYSTGLGYSIPILSNLFKI